MVLNWSKVEYSGKIWNTEGKNRGSVPSCSIVVPYLVPYVKLCKMVYSDGIWVLLSPKSA